MIQEAFLKACAQLEEAKASSQIQNYAVIGAFAVARVAIPRATGDIDFIIRRSDRPLGAVAALLGGVARIGDFSDPLLGSVSFSIEIAGYRTPVQLIEFPKAWECLVFEDLEFQSIAKQRIPFASAKSLVLLKLYAGSALDLQDATSIIENAKFSALETKELLSRARALRVNRRLERLLSQNN